MGARTIVMLTAATPILLAASAAAQAPPSPGLDQLKTLVTDWEGRGRTEGLIAQAWRQLIWNIQCKAEYAGKWAVSVRARGTTQICSGYGEKAPEDLGERWHSCLSCGLSIDRDHNAARTILALGESTAEVGTKCLVR